MELEQEIRQVKRIIFECCKDLKDNNGVYTEDFFSVDFGSYVFVPIDDLTIYKGEYLMALQGRTGNIYLLGIPVPDCIKEIENDVRKKLRRYWAGGEKL